MSHLPEKFLLMLHWCLLSLIEIAPVSSLIDRKLSIFEEAAIEQVQQDGITKECDSIPKNELWEIVPRLVGKSAINSRWLFKIKYAADENIEK